MYSLDDGKTPVETVRTRQIAALRQLVNLNEPVALHSLVAEPVWKILVLDKAAQNIISPLLPLKDLRELGVTLHLLLESAREPLPDVPAVYLVTPNDENVGLIADDLRKGMYDSFYINFVSPLSRPRLETLAAAAVQGNTVQQVQKVVDQYVNFISLEDDLFVLRRCTEDSPLSYYAISDPGTSDSAMDALLDAVVDGLFAVCATMSVVPVIRCAKDNAAEQVAIRLEQRLRENLRDARNNLFTMEGVKAGQLHASRPLLVIADRGIDLASMLHHTWTYQALVHDLLGLDQNRVQVPDPKTGKPKEFDLSNTDRLWSKHKGSAFPLVAEAIQEDLEACKNSEKDIQRLKESMGLGAGADEAIGTYLSDATNKLTSTVASLPEILERKRLIDLHTNVATTLLEGIKGRKLDVLFELEEKLLNRAQLESPLMNVLESFTDKDDVLRVILIEYLCSTNTTKDELNSYISFLKERDIDESSLKFVEQLRSVSRLHNGMEDHHGAGTKTVSMFSKLLSHSSRFVMEGVKNLVPRKHDLPLTKVVDSLIGPSSSGAVALAGGVASAVGGTTSSLTDNYRYFDPKLQHALTKEQLRSRAQQPAAQDVIVFVIGGGNYVEYQNLVDMAKRRQLSRLTYGCTELVNPKQFMEQAVVLDSHPRDYKLLETFAALATRPAAPMRHPEEMHFCPTHLPLSKIIYCRKLGSSFCSLCP